MLFLAAQVSLGCAGGGAPVVHWEGAPVAIEAVLVGRVDVRLNKTRAWNHYEKLRDTLGVVEQRQGLDALAPWEIDVAGDVDEAADYLSKTTLRPRAAIFGISVERIAVLEVSLSERVHKQTTHLDKRGSQANARGYDSTLEVSARLLHPSTGQVIASVQRELEENRFVDTPDYDARPEARRLLRETVSALLEAAADDAVVEAAPEPRTAWPVAWESPARVLRWPSETGETLEETLIRLDAVDREARLYARMRYFDPHITLERALEAESRGPSLLIDGAWVRAAGQHPLETTFQLRRMWRRANELTFGP